MKEIILLTELQSKGSINIYLFSFKVHKFSTEKYNKNYEKNKEKKHLSDIRHNKCIEKNKSNEHKKTYYYKSSNLKSGGSKRKKGSYVKSHIIFKNDHHLHEKKNDELTTITELKVKSFLFKN